MRCWGLCKRRKSTKVTDADAEEAGGECKYEKESNYFLQS